MSKLKILSKILCTTILSSTLIASSAFAELPASTLDFYDLNGIYYYNPTGSAVNCISGTSQNYAGAQILSQAQLDAISANQPYYESAASQYGFPWQIIAAIHYKEHSLSRSNPSNGQGAYQLYSYTNGGNNSNAFYPAGDISDSEFQRQTDIMAQLIYENYGRGLDLNDPEDVKLLFFRYNGTADRYVQKALNMGYTQEEANHGNGSVYVMNRYDPERDPTNRAAMKEAWKGMYVGDGKWDANATTTSFGAFVVYESLGGAGVCTDGLVSGGMTYEQAYEFVKIYVDNPSECYDYSDMCDIYDIEPGGNCSTYSSYFLGKYTTLGKVGLPNGRNVVNSLANDYGLPTGTEPRPYAIFSTDSGSTICSDGRKCGHTGVVLGVNEDANEIYIGQMAYSHTRAWGLSVIRNSLDKYRNGSYSYAYTDQVLKSASFSSSSEIIEY